MNARRSFMKLVAAGNDFLFLDSRTEEFSKERRGILARTLCDRHFGVGADGVAFVERGRSADLAWDFYNSDGSKAEMCGNAARCMVRWAQRKLGLVAVSFETSAGVVRGSVGEGGPTGRIEVELPFVSRKTEPASTESGKAHFVNTGVPHAVVEIENLAFAKQEIAIIETLRWLPQAGPDGANVTFFAREGAGSISSKTFERGVEGFTLACGTGVVAAAIASLAPGAMERDCTVAVEAPGGRLEVRFLKDEAGARLLGPTEFVCEGEFTEEFLK